MGDDLQKAIQHAMAYVGWMPKEIDTGLSNFSYFSLSEKKQTKNKGPVPVRAEPHTPDSTTVALHAHGGDVPAQGFQSGFQCYLRWTSPLKSSSLDTLHAARNAVCDSLGKTLG